MLGFLTSAPPPDDGTGRVFKTTYNPRMAGSVPAWVKADSARDGVARSLASATSASEPGTFKAALAYQMEPKGAKPTPEEFTFYDLLDMVNPFQHVPLVNIAYRHLTGDEIKSAPTVIGGALFGGVVGAAGGLVNVIVKEETGEDIAGNVIGLASGRTPSFKEHEETTPAEKKIFSPYEVY